MLDGGSGDFVKQHKVGIWVEGGGLGGGGGVQPAIR